MDDARKNAYRFLLYWALLECRGLPWRPSGLSRLLNPRQWVSTIRRVHYAGDIMDWLHNLALFSSLDFQGFDEGQFWRGLEKLDERYPEYQVRRYQGVFERRLAELRHRPTT